MPAQHGMTLPELLGQQRRCQTMPLKTTTDSKPLQRLLCTEQRIDRVGKLQPPPRCGVDLHRIRGQGGQQAAQILTALLVIVSHD